MYVFIVPVSLPQFLQSNFKLQATKIATSKLLYVYHMYSFASNLIFYGILVRSFHVLALTTEDMAFVEVESNVL